MRVRARNDACVHSQLFITFLLYEKKSVVEGAKAMAKKKAARKATRKTTKKSAKKGGRKKAAKKAK